MRPDPSSKLKAVAPKAGPNRTVIGAVVAAVVLVGVVGAILIGNSNKSVSAKDQAVGSASSTQPAGVVGGQGGGIAVNAAVAKSNAPTMDIYADFQCHTCAEFEEVMGSALAQMAKAGEIKLIMHPLSFVDTNLKNDSSKRSANAAACAANTGKFLEYHSAVFAGQPEKEGAGYTDAKLTEFAGTAGIAGDALPTWQKCTSSGQYDQYITDVQTAGEKAGVFDTPTVKLNGKNITETLSTADALVAQVKAATS